MVGIAVRGPFRIFTALGLLLTLTIAPLGVADQVDDRERGAVSYVGPGPVFIPAGSINLTHTYVDAETNETKTVYLGVLGIKDDMRDRLGSSYVIAGAYCQVPAGAEECMPGMEGVEYELFCNGKALRPSNFDVTQDTYVYLGTGVDQLRTLEGGRGGACLSGMSRPATIGEVTYWPAA